MKSFQKSKWILILFIFHVILNLSYMVWLKSQESTILTAWVYLTPMFAFFYIVFSMISSLELNRRTSLGLSMSLCIILFEMILEVILFSYLYYVTTANSLALLFFFILNSLVLAMMSYNKTLFSAK